MAFGSIQLHSWLRHIDMLQFLIDLCIGYLLFLAIFIVGIVLLASVVVLIAGAALAAIARWFNIEE